MLVPRPATVRTKTRAPITACRRPQTSVWHSHTFGPASSARGAGIPALSHVRSRVEARGYARRMAGRIVVFGASGYTGSLIAERLAAGGAEPVLDGRDTPRLGGLAERLGGLQVAKADALRQNSVVALVGKGDVLVSTVGPFTRYGAVAVRAAIAAGAVYLDSTGEPTFIRRVFEQFGRAAERNGAALLTAQGFDWVPGALAA